MKRILICGATGFIGRNLLDHFYNKKDYTIRAVYNIREVPQGYDRVEWIRCDLRDPSELPGLLKDVDIVLQFAATTTGAKDIVSKPYMHVTDNVVMNALLLQEAFLANVEHFVFPSCTIMYQKSEQALKETDFNPSDEILPFYFGAGSTKVYLENLCNFYSKLGNTKHTVIRHSNMYGPYDKYDLEKSHVTGASITKVMNSTDEVVVWGTGEERRDLLYVEDLVEFVEKAINLQTEKFELVNVGLGEGIKIIDLVKKIINVANKDIIIKHDLSKPTVPTSLFLDCTKAKEKFGWDPRHSLEAGLAKTIEWYKENINE